MEKAKTFVKELLGIVVLSLVIVLPIRFFIAQPYVVSGESMIHTFQNNNYLIVDEVTYQFQTPKRGDIIVFKAPPTALAADNQDTNLTVHYIKRIIGLPGETVQVDGDQVEIFNASNTKGTLLSEPYTNFDTSLPSGYVTRATNIHEKVTLKQGEYFVMGDNRYNSSDSRIWGVLPKANITGRVFLRLFPFNEITDFPGVHNNY